MGKAEEKAVGAQRLVTVLRTAAMYKDNYRTDISVRKAERTGQPMLTVDYLKAAFRKCHCRRRQDGGKKEEEGEKQPAVHPTGIHDAVKVFTAIKRTLASSS